VNEPEENEAVVEVKDLAREFGSRRVLDGISFCVRRGETLVIMGGSGCGKSTLLRHIIGSLKPTSGSVKIFGQEVTTMSVDELNRLRLRFGMNFQFGALLQSLTVGENVALPLLENSRVDPKIVELVVKMKLELVGLTGFENHKPSQISGGMRKRVGLARAVVMDPEILFSDEPTSGLDPIMTAVIDKLTMDLAEHLKMTSIVVTHDMPSAFRIADKMLMLGVGARQGKVIAYGTPEEIQNHHDAEVQQFIRGEPDGPVPLSLSGKNYIANLLETEE
jgi:phospholipid/cholesterol/gamma-HCH transport system ATP-binding protein